MSYFLKKILAPIILALLVFFILFRSNIENSDLIKSISADLLQLSTQKKGTSREITSNSENNLAKNTNDNKIEAARPRGRPYRPITVSLLNTQSEKLILMLKNKDTSWQAIRIQQAKIRMLKSKFALPLLNHEKWPETVLIYLIHRENFSIEEIDNAENFSDFNLSKQDVQNLSTSAVNGPMDTK